MQTATTPSAYEGGMATSAIRPEGAPSLASRISWGAVLAGAVVALTISLMLNALGAGIGANTVDAAAHASPTAAAFGTRAAIWLLVSNLIGLAVGGYVAARLSGTADNTDGTLHGLAVWGTTFLISAALLGNLLAGVASTAATGASSMLGGVASGAGSVAAAAGQQAASQPGMPSLQTAVQGVTDRVQNALSGAGGAPASMTSDQRKAEIGTLVARRVTDGQLAAPDRERLNQLVAAEYNISPQDAQARVAQAEQQATEAARQAEATARRAADTAAAAASIAAYSIFGIMLLGGIAAVVGARRGTRDLLLIRGVRHIG